jgi:hypothetical protein
MNQNIFIKKSFLLFLLFFATINLNGQTGIFFQAIARDNNANPAKDRKLYVQTNIIQSTTTGTIVLTEEHQTFTDAFGIFSIMVGSGKRVGGTVTGLSTIDWSKDPYYLNIKIVITPIAASNTWDYTKEWVDIGTTIFGAVPFALYSANTANINEKLNKIKEPKNFATKTILGQNIINCRPFSVDSQKIFDFLVYYKSYKQVILLY